MKNMLENLLALQNLEFRSGRTSPEREQSIQALRAKIPSQTLAHYDRLLARGKKGLATVRGGVCGECHIKVAVGTLGALAFGTDIQMCGNCGRYLYLPEDEPVCASPSPAKKKPAKRKKEVSEVSAHAD